MRAIFISYRRDDTEGHAGRLFRDLCEHFGDDAVFLDVAGIELGRDFRVAIDQQVASCGVLLAVIGTHWLTATDSEGKRRLDDPFDFVRLETAAALRREIPVIPVLVHEAQMPRPEQLPDDLKELAFRNSMSLSHTRWDSDVELLAHALGQFVQRPAGNGSATPHTAAEPAPDPVASAAVPAIPAARRNSTAKTLGLVTLIVTLAGGGFAMFDRARKQAEAVAEVQRLATEQAEARAVQEAAARAAAEQQARERDATLAQAKTDAAAARDEAVRVRAEAERRAGEREAALARQMAANDKALRDKSQAAQTAQAAEAARAAQALQIAAATAAAARAAPAVASPGNGSAQITAASCRLIANGVYRVDFAGTARTTGTAFLFTGSDGLANAQPQPKTALGCGAWVRAANACTHAPNQPAETRWLVQREVSFSQMPTYVKAGLFRDVTRSAEGKLAEARFAVTCH